MKFDDDSNFDLVREEAKAARESVGGNWLTIYELEYEYPEVLVFFDSRGVPTVTKAPETVIV